jgi:hypothetical protein
MKTFTEFSTLVLRRGAAAKVTHASLEGDALVEALAAELGAPADRIPRLLEALEIVGDQLEQVRLIRVYQGETGPHGAVSRGEFHYALDRVAGSSGRGGRERSGRGDRGGDRGGGGDRRDKPRGLGSLKLGGDKVETEREDRPARGEIPRAGIGWQLTAAPREFRGGDDRGGPRRKGGPRPPGRGRPGGGLGGGPGGDSRGPRPFGDRPRGPRPEGAGAGAGGPGGAPRSAGPRPPRDPNAPRRERRPLGPDANGLGPDGKPWDPERKRLRDAERATRDSARGAAGGHDGEAAPAAMPAAAAVAPAADE